MKSERIGNSKKMKALGITLALFFTVPLIHAQNLATETSEMSLLFVQNAQGITYDSASKLLTLEGVSPVVTFFAERPDRVAGHVLLPGFVEIWEEGADSFKKDPPNASLSIFDGKQIQSVVVELAEPRIKNNQLSYTVLRVLDGELPTTGGASSLFIDGFLKGGALGAAGGALIGAIAGDAGKGAAIGAGIGAVGGGIHKHKQEEAGAQAQAQAANDASKTRVINIQNPNGSVTPVSLHLVASGWQGPKGEIYPTLPTADQLQGTYGLK
jgi:hypothetical protein